MSIRRGQLRAFTLFELLLAMAMVAAVSLALYSSMSTAYKAKKTAEAAVRPARAMSAAADLIGRDLEGVLPPTGILAGPFVGTHDGSVGNATDWLEFCAVGDDSTNEDNPLAEGIRRIDLLVNTDSNPPVLIRRVTRNLLSQVEPVPEDEVLARGVRSFSVRYYDGTQWYEDWDSTLMDDTLPVAVYVELVMDADPARGADGPRYTIGKMIPVDCNKPGA